ncbi:alpha/beta fold hydrolase [Nocardia camponoti]|uniref:Alpha/beta hydrolase n=1 Tax=Nocardia camponoti TaxID=1616106 RepID=A0A917VAE6_9NOCA|nr:alpha/beta hydrolase [Nocardia camponoti]GGK54937.1 alpha/beta hydrolase [Nocardia camponoti]
MDARETITVPCSFGDIAVHLYGPLGGVGPSLLLLHANPGDHRDFAEVLGSLAAEWSVAAVDWPGYGASTVHDPSLITIDALADVAMHVAEALSEKGFGPFTVIGNSVGGYAAVRLAQRLPDLVRGVILVQPAGFVPHNALIKQYFHFAASEAVARRFIGPNARMYLGPLGRGGSRAIFDRATQVAKNPTRLAVYRSLWRSFADPNFNLATPDLLPATLPVLVVWGRSDPTNPWLLNRNGVRRALPNAKISVLPTHHEPFAENPALFLDTVSEFLTECAELRR